MDRNILMGQLFIAMVDIMPKISLKCKHGKISYNIYVIPKGSSQGMLQQRPDEN
jgi:hypothetical protein